MITVLVWWQHLVDAEVRDYSAMETANKDQAGSTTMLEKEEADGLQVTNHAGQLVIHGLQPFSLKLDQTVSLIIYR